MILSSDVETLKRNVKLNASGRQLPPDSQLEQQILDQLILEKIQLQEAEKLGIRVDDTRLRQAIEQIANEKGLSIQALHDELKLSGISWETYREQIRKEVVISEIEKPKYAADQRTAEIMHTKQLPDQQKRNTPSVKFKFALKKMPVNLSEKRHSKKHRPYLEIAPRERFRNLAIAKSMVLVH